jgi:MerR family regulatory protein
VAEVMTIGTLSRRTGVPVKALRAYEDMGLLYTVGRSPGNYRLFGQGLVDIRGEHAARGKIGTVHPNADVMVSQQLDQEIYEVVVRRAMRDKYIGHAAFFF